MPRCLSILSRGFVEGCAHVEECRPVDRCRDRCGD